VTKKKFDVAGLIVWNQIRHQWGGNKRSESQAIVREPRIR
jgi:hypothetical protein